MPTPPAPSRRQILLQILAELEIETDPSPDEVIRITWQHDQLEFRTLIELGLDTAKFIRIQHFFPLQVPPALHPAAAEFACRISADINRGALIFDHDDGTFCFRSHVCAQEGEIDPELFCYEFIPSVRVASALVAPMVDLVFRRSPVSTVVEQFEAALADKEGRQDESSKNSG